MSASSVKVERVGDRIHALIPFRDGKGPEAAKRIPGARWDRSAKRWVYALDWAVCAKLRVTFGNSLVIGPNLAEWAWGAREMAERMAGLATARSAKLSHMPGLAPTLAAAMDTRPYQQAGVAFLAAGRQALLADEMRLGKTLQAIGALIEAKPEGGTFAVFTIKTAVLATWKPELERWLGDEVEILTMHGSRKQREAALALAARPRPRRFRILVANVEVARIRGIKDNNTKKGGQPEYPDLFDLAWDGFVIDDSPLALLHRVGVPTQTRVGMRRLAETNPAAVRYVLTGTPFRGKHYRIWGALNWLKPDVYTSYWRWVELYFDVHHDGYGKVIGGMRPEMEKAFYAELDGLMLRRTQAEVRPELPATLYGGTPLDGKEGNPVGVWLPMEGKQATQYKAMARDAVLEFEGGGEMLADGILAELTRAKQLAGSALDSVDGKILPCLPSNKWEWIVAHMTLMGIAGEDPEGDSKVIIASQFTRYINLISRELQAMGIDHRKITGEVTAKKRAQAQSDFQAEDGPRVMLLNTTAGGVSLTLDRARTIILHDETWIDDDQKQVEARIIPTTAEAARVASSVYYLRSLGTIDEGISRTNLTAADLIAAVMDGRRGVELAKQLLTGKEAVVKSAKSSTQSTPVRVDGKPSRPLGSTRVEKPTNQGDKMAKSYPRADLLEKELTPLQVKFVKYITAQTGYEVDETTVVLFQALRTPFQKSDANQADLEKRREAAAARAEEAEEEAPAPRKAAAKKAPAKKAAPAKRAAAAKKAPAKKAAGRRLSSVADESPFDEEEEEE